MYIGPWQEYRLARAYRRSNTTDSESVSSEPLNEHVDDKAIEDLLTKLQMYPENSSLEQKKSIVSEFLRKNSTRSEAGSVCSLPEGVEDLLDQRKSWKLEMAKERRNTQIRKDQIPNKMLQLERRKTDFQSLAPAFLQRDIPQPELVSEQIENEEQASGSNQDCELNNETRASILPTRPFALFDSFLLQPSVQRPGYMEPEQEFVKGLPFISSLGIENATGVMVGRDEIPAIQGSDSGRKEMEDDIEDDVDQLLDWTNHLGTAADDDFLFK